MAAAVPHTTVPFRIEDEGTKLPDIVWGLDAAWISEGNVRRGVNFAGADLIGIMRLSFQTNAAVTDGTLTADQKTTLNERLRIASYAPYATINLNSDQEAGVDSWYRSSNTATQAERWSALIAATKKYVEQRGRKVTSISPFNEPDYSDWKQGSKADFKAICKMLREDERYAADFKDVAFCGGNVLNPDYAMEWYNYCKDYLEEGNTHQLAGSFDNFVNFYKQVAADGKVGVADELHNTMECMVASEYGLQKGIWWGTCDHTRSQFMKASRGTRMAYAENRNNWTAASVYRHPSGLVQGFGGTSERQAVATTFRFAAMDRDVFYNGQGPMREYNMSLPGGTGYQKGQTNAETLVNIQGGDDIMPALPTEATAYRFVNRYSGHVLSATGNVASSGNDMVQMKFVFGNQVQRWVVTPVDSRCGGDFSYFTIANAKDTTLYPDILNWSLEDGGGVILYKGGLGDNELWFFEYASDGYFYIRSKHSGLYLEVTPGTEAQQKLAGRKVQQGLFKGTALQQWKMVPATVNYNAVAPAAPTELKATSQPASVLLSWTAPSDRDLKGYNILRSENGNDWYVINTNVSGTSYIDNTVRPGKVYYYSVQAEDLSLNRSERSESVSSQATGEQACIMQISCDSLVDNTLNGNHAALAGTEQYGTGVVGQALIFDGKANFMQLPATIAESTDLTLSAWVYYRGGSKWQRIFDFGNDTDHYMFLTPNNSYTNRMRLAIKNGGSEQTLDYKSALSANKWHHIAVTFGSSSVTLYLDGEAVATTKAMTIRPSDFHPIFNYVGRSQFSADPLFYGTIDDVRVYNYCISAEEVARIYGVTVGVTTMTRDIRDTTPEAYTIDGVRVSPSQMRPGKVYIVGGKKVRK